MTCLWEAVLGESVREWLGKLDLEHLTAVFEQNQVTIDDLPLLSDSDLKELGVALGPRRRLLNAIADIARDGAGSKTAFGVNRRTAPADAERRQLTIMFVDLVGSTELSARLDPEDMRDVIRTFQDASAGVITRFEGHVAKYLGDGILAYFGWPRAHEDEAERAGRAALELVRKIEELKTQPSVNLQVRIGIATGLVVVGDLIGEGGSEQDAVVGTTPNLAARLQTLAEPGSVVIAEVTARLAGAELELRSMGAKSLKGLPGPTEVFELIGERASVSRFEARTGRTPQLMIGRDQELAFLVERWSQAKAGEGQAVLLTGEAGIGKSRISKALLDAVATEAYTSIRYQCSPYYTDSALWPAIQQLIHAAGFVGDDETGTKLDKLEALLAQAGDDFGDTATLMARLIGIEDQDRYGPLNLTPRAQRLRTLGVLVEQLLGLSDRQPVLMLLEDAHWIDPTTLELLEQCLERIASARVLIVITSRPDQQPELGEYAHLTNVQLKRLRRSAARAIVARLGGEDLPDEMVETIITRTDGVPLFVEELTKAILETGETSIPESLHDTLMARLDQNYDVKEIAQTAAVIGRNFSYGLLRAVAGKSESELHSALKKLIAAEMVFPHGQRTELHYNFKHALVRDAAYQSLLKSKRQSLHARIFETLESDFPYVVEMQPELLAHHCTEARMVETAVGYWRRAADRALQKSASLEAVRHYKKALNQLASCPNSPQRTKDELDLQLGLGVASILPKSHGSEEVRIAFARAEELCRETSDTTRHFRALRGLWHWHSVSAYFQEAALLAEQLSTLASRSGGPAHRLMAHRIMGYTKLTLGEYESGKEQFALALELYDPSEQENYVLSHGEDPGLWCYAYLAWVDDWLGNRDQALRWKDRGTELARSFERRMSLICN